MVAKQDVELNLGLLVATHAGLLLHFLDAVLDGLEVLYLQFRVDDFLVANGIDTAVNMHDAVVVEAAEHMDDGVALAYVGQELVAQALTLAGTFHEARNIDDVADSRHDATRVHKFGKLGQSFVRHGDLSELSINGAEGEIGSLSFRAREAIEEG